MIKNFFTIHTSSESTSSERNYFKKFRGILPKRSLREFAISNCRRSSKLLPTLGRRWNALKEPLKRNTACTLAPKTNTATRPTVLPTSQCQYALKTQISPTVQANVCYLPSILKTASNLADSDRAPWLSPPFQLLIKTLAGLITLLLTKTKRVSHDERIK